MSASVSQVTQGTNGANGSYAEVAFDDTPAAGDLLVFLVGVNHANASDLNAGPGLTLLSDSGGIARVYYQWYVAGQNPSWCFGVQGATAACIAYDIDPGGPIDSVIDATPAWGAGDANPATDGQPTVATSAAAANGLAITFLCQLGDWTVTTGGSWTSEQQETSSDVYLYSAQEAAVASSSATADWDVNNGADFNEWEGVTFVVRAFTGVDPPAPVTGAAQYVLPLSSVTLTGAAGFAGGHTGTVAWTSPEGTPPVTSGASTDTATISNIGTPQKLTTWEYTFTATQDDGQVVAATALVTVPPPAMFQAFGSPVNIALSQVQSSNPHSIDSATSTVTIATAAGSTIVLGIVAIVGENTPLAVVSVSDTASNTWTYSTEQASQSPPANGSYYTLNSYYGFAAIAVVTDAAAVTQITVELNETIVSTNNGLFSLVAYEFTGVASGSALDGAASAGVSFFNEFTAAIYTAGITSDIVVVAAASNFGFNGVTPDTYTIGPVNNTAYAIVSSPGTQTVTMSYTSEQEISGWAILGVGNPAFQGIAWYGTEPVNYATGDTWVK
jgi:hypothetical protein